jgi:hypothetical protein
VRTTALLRAHGPYDQTPRGYRARPGGLATGSRPRRAVKSVSRTHERARGTPYLRGGSVARRMREEVDGAVPVKIARSGSRHDHDVRGVVVRVVPEPD